jgi:TolB-like protein/Tfp pilus assembly protein PilF
MPSRVPGYEYDIFISYRQNDNKYDSWVTEFVANLNKELEATIKDKLTIYFDENPKDGLLETHIVDESLAKKLKCLIFIPILSQTYCDSKSFAWLHELCTFNKLAKEDQFGRDIRPASGNVASRILPVKIHDLDPEDKTLLENELGGVLRCIEFIYKSTGVNRPLRANEDHAQDNLNKTYYRDQINKVANAVKEIITAIKKHNQQNGEVPREVVKAEPDPPKNLKAKIISGSFLVLALIVLGYFFIPKLFKSSGPIEKSIAVLPFRNDSPNDSTTYFIDSVMEEILTNLQTIKDIRVISRTSVEQYRGPTKPTIPEIAKKLGVNYIVEGSGQKYSNKLRLRVQLIRAAKESHLWAKSYEQEINEVNDIFSIQSQIAQAIAAELEAVITPHEKQLIEKTPTDNLEAYRLYMIGNFLMTQWTEDAFRKAIDHYQQAIELDSSFALSNVGLASAYFELSIWDVPSPSPEFIPKAKTWALKALEINNNLAEAYFVIGAIKYIHEWDWNGSELAFKKGMELNPNYVYGRINYANFLTAMGRFKESITIGQQTLKLNPLDPSVYNELAFAMFFNGQDEEALELCNKGLELNPNFGQTLTSLVQMYAWKGLFDQAISNWGKIMELNGNDIRKISAFVLGLAGQAFGVAGHRAEAIPFLNELNRRAEKGDYVAKIYFAFLYKAQGENEKAIAFFEKGFNEKEPLMVWINVFFIGDSIQSNRRFKELLRKMRFEE